MKKMRSWPRTEQPSLPFDEAMLSLPSAKQRLVSGVVHPWGKFYAAFSLPFAETALRLIYREAGGILYDPFVGSGTTVVAAAKLGIQVIGNDLDPVSSLISRARVAFYCDARKVRDLLENRTTRVEAPFAKEAQGYFTDGSLAYASGVYSKITRGLPHSRATPLEQLLADESGEFDSEAVALAALIVASLAAARTVRGSNPVWQRRAINGENVRIKSLADAAVNQAQLMIEDLQSHGFPARRKVRIVCANAGSNAIRDKTVGAVLTSPPYLNRLDYVINHLPQLLLMSGLHPIDIGALRKDMTGTTKVVSKMPADPRVGRTCFKLLKQIREHRSHASEGYYLHIYVQYFNDMLSIFERLKRQCKPGARGIMVVQTSFYKDILVDSIAVFREMAANLGFAIQALAKEEVAAHYGNLSPAQMRYVPGKRLHEWLLHLHF